MPSTIQMQTSRLLLRQPTAEDYELWTSAHRKCGPPQNKWDNPPRKESALTQGEFDALLMRLTRGAQNDKSYVLWVIDQARNEWVGTMSLFHVIRSRQHTAWLGYHIFNPHWRKGYATESAQAMISFGFNRLELHRVEALVELDNAASQRVAIKIGLQDEGIRRRRILVHNHWTDARSFATTVEAHQPQTIHRTI